MGGVRRGEDRLPGRQDGLGLAAMDHGRRQQPQAPVVSRYRCASLSEIGR